MAAIFFLVILIGGHNPAQVCARSRLLASKVSARRASTRSIVAADFGVGDRVRVRKDVRHQHLQGGSSRDMVSVVISSWSICEEDPVCCCAELATDAPIQVEFAEPDVWNAYYAEVRSGRAGGRPICTRAKRGTAAADTAVTAAPRSSMPSAGRARATTPTFRLTGDAD
jgi:hypothetical protein